MVFFRFTKYLQELSDSNRWAYITLCPRKLIIINFISKHIALSLPVVCIRHSYVGYLQVD